MIGSCSVARADGAARGTAASRGIVVTTVFVMDFAAFVEVEERVAEREAEGVAVIGGIRPDT